MRVTAVRLVEHGKPLDIQDVELPDPGDGEVVLDIAFSGVNPVDMYAAAGRCSRCTARVSASWATRVCWSPMSP